MERSRSPRRRIGGTLLAILSMVAMIVALAVPAMAVHDTGAFQLDGDASSSTDPITPPALDDWDKVCHQANPTECPSGANTTGPAKVSWTNDGALNASIFTGGGSKDPINIDQWAWKDNAGGLPDKDNLLHAFAARYSLPPDAPGGPTACPAGTSTSCEVLFFGSDRYDNSGDAQQGFWFFQNRVGLGSTSLGGGQAFTGLHRNGDILIISDFSNGGTVSTISVYTWDSTVTNNLRLLGTSDAAKCSSGAASGDAFCGIVNPTNGTAVPWSFRDKSGNSTYLNGEFYEAGINLSLLGLQDECFSSVLSETRSSTSTTATLKDFVLGQFSTCTATASSAPTVGSGATVTPGTSVSDTVTITGSGVPNPPTPSSATNQVKFYLCGPVTAPATCATGGTLVGSGSLSGSGPTATSTSPAVNTTGYAPGRYCFRIEWAGDTNYTAGVTHTAESECFNIAKLPTQTVTTPVDGSGTPTSTIVLGQSIYDRAVVTGAAGGGDPTGTVAFSVCPVSSGTTCSSATTALGSPTLASDGNPATFTSTATSNAFTPSATGSYCFQANYSGSAVYDPSSDSNINECFNVIKVPTSTVTTPTDSSGTPVSVITLGDTIHDLAVVTGEVRGGDPTGTVAFAVCGPAESGLCTSGGTSLGVKALVGDGNPATFTASASSDDFTPTLPGRYCFRAEYGGNTPYLGSSDSSSTECFIVKDTTSTTSAQTWLPNDSAHVALSGGGAASGSMKFELKSGTCAAPGSTLYTQTVSLDGSGNAATSNSSISVSATSNVIWVNTFTPSDPSRVVGSTHCESTSLTIVN